MTAASRPPDDTPQDESDVLEKYPPGFRSKPVAPDDTPTRLLDDETIHFSSCGLLDSSSDVCDCRVAELRAEVSRLREERELDIARLETLGKFLTRAESDVSRLQQEHALLRRSLDILVKQMADAGV
jgi:hypothetical protein